MAAAFVRKPRMSALAAWASARLSRCNPPPVFMYACNFPRVSFSKAWERWCGQISRGGPVFIFAMWPLCSKPVSSSGSHWRWTGGLLSRKSAGATQLLLRGVWTNGLWLRASPASIQDQQQHAGADAANQRVLQSVAHVQSAGSAFGSGRDRCRFAVAISGVFENQGFPGFYLCLLCAVVHGRRTLSRADLQLAVDLRDFDFRNRRGRRDHQVLHPRSECISGQVESYRSATHLDVVPAVGQRCLREDQHAGVLGGEGGHGA